MTQTAEKIDQLIDTLEKCLAYVEDHTTGDVRYPLLWLEITKALVTARNITVQ